MNKEVGENDNSIKENEENPYKYLGIRKKDAIPAIITTILGGLILYIIYIFIDFLSGGTLEIVKILSLITMISIIIIFIVYQNGRYKLWEKDKKICRLVSAINEKNNELRNLTGELEKYKEKLKNCEDRIKNIENELKISKSEYQKLLQEREELSERIKDAERRISELINQKTLLENEKNRINNELRQCISKVKVYEKRAKPDIRIYGQIERRRKVLFVFGEDNDIYHILIENKGYSPAFNIKGTLIYHPRVGKPFSKGVNINVLFPTQEAIDIVVGNKNANGICEKVEYSLEYEDLLGVKHQIKNKVIKFA